MKKIQLFYLEYCPHCKKEIASLTPQQIVERMLRFPQGSKAQILAPTVRDRKGEYSKLFEAYKKSGFTRVEVDGIAYMLDEEIVLDNYTVRAYAGNHATCEKTVHFIITDGERTLFYGLDSAWLLYAEVQAIISRISYQGT